MNAENLNDTSATQAESTQATTAADGAAALAAGGNSSVGAGSAAERIAHREHSAFALSMMPFGVLLNEAESAMKIGELVMDGPLRDETLAVLSRMHHALFCRRVGGVDEAARRDAFHERLHALRQRVSEAKQAEEATRLQAEAERRAAMAASASVDPHSAGPQPMGGVVDAAVRTMREEWRSDVTHTNNIVQSLVIEMGQLRAAVGHTEEALRDHVMSLQARAAELERVAEMYQRKLYALEAAQKQARFDAQMQSARIDVVESTVMRAVLPEGVLRAEGALCVEEDDTNKRLAELEKRMLVLDGIDVVDDAGKVVRREPPKRYPWTGEKDIVHITSEAEMVEAFGEGRGQAMWAECEARKSGGAK